MQAQQYLFNGSVQEKQKFGQSKKFTQVEAMLSLLREMNIPEMGAFTLGYVIGQLGIRIDDKENRKLLNKIGESLQFVRDGLIQHRSLVGAIVETMDTVKRSNQCDNNTNNYFQSHCQNNNNSSPKRPQQNKMRSEQQRFQDFQYGIKMSQQQQKLNKSTIQLFIETFQFLLSQLAIDPDYLHTLWHQQQYQQQQQLQSRQMIDKMMAEDTQKRQIQQNKKLQCQICLMDIDFSQMAPIEGCKHIFHIACIHQHIKSSINSNIIEIKCPMEECKSYLTVNDVEAYVDADLMEKYYNFSLNKYVESGNNMTSWCPTAGCSAVFEYDEALDNYRCPVCRKHYCLMCRTDYHYGMSCAEYRISKTFSEEDRKFEDFVRGAKFKQCPKCKFWVQRVAGCSSMACRCGIQFCYDCGGTGCPHGRCTGSGRVQKK